ncbi:MAG: DUF1565 domain-containing protein [Planctomycetes bacterium]|nr:DUF1565 domain-containing protein [Planctomycetota bacterium]
MSIRRGSIGGMAFLVLSAPVVLGRDLRVPGDYPTIGGAIAASSDGDTVLVAPGLYRENIDFGGKEIILRSEVGPERTIIDGSGASADALYASTVTFRSREGRGATLEGFTITGGLGCLHPDTGLSSGGGIYIRTSSPTIRSNIVMGNTATDAGGGIYAYAGGPLIEENVIAGNRSRAAAGGLCAALANGVIVRRNRIVSNHTEKYDGGGVLILLGRFDIRDNLIAENTAGGSGGGAAISLLGDFSGADCLFESNTVVGNRAREAGGLLLFASDMRGQEIPVFHRSLICGNSASERGPEIWGISVGLIASCGIGDGTYDGLNGNTRADPLFVDPASGDFRLMKGSPAIDAAEPDAWDRKRMDLSGAPRLVDGDGDGIVLQDLGAYEYQPRFIRGDASDDGKIDIADPIRILAYLFAAAPGGCLDAFDAGDDGSVGLADPVLLLNGLFAGRWGASDLVAEGCRYDETDDGLGCSGYASCD